MLVISCKRDLVGKLVSLVKNKLYKRNFIIVISLLITAVISFGFISTNENYYAKTIAKIITITEKEQSQADNISGNVEKITDQQIKAIIMNGAYKGKEIRLQNTTSYSQAYDQDFKVGDEVFVLITVDANKAITSSKIVDFKRDKYIVYIIIIFILLILLIGGFKGFRSLVSLLVNISIFSAVVVLYLHGWNLILISLIASILFITVSIILVSGINRKTTSAIIGTMAGTLISMLITAVVLLITHAKGVHYEEMAFLSTPPEQIFLFELLVGTLGGIMDIAITISSSIKEMYDKNPNIERKILIKSGMEIGKDIMGTMANTLVFAYISGSIPFILLWLKNDFSISYIINFNISLEIIRALTGSIGIVISIPVTLFISVGFLKNNVIGDA